MKGKAWESEVERTEAAKVRCCRNNRRPGVKMYENNAKLQNDQKVKLDWLKRDEPRMDEGDGNRDVWTEM